MSSTQKKRKATTYKPQLKKIKKTKLSPTPQLTLIRSLPDDLLVSCFARVSRLYYPTLSLVSKRFRSLLTSPELYQTRSLLGRSESCLYVCLRFPPDPNPRWYTLCRKPDQTRKKKKKSSGYVLATLPIPHSPPAHSSGLVAVGSHIYNIGGSTPSSSVSILDCWSHTWREAPSMQVERDHPSANLLDGKIYVAGGCKHDNSSKWMEVFDPKTQTWEAVSSPGALIYDCNISKSAGVDGKVYILGDKGGVAYNPKDGKWNALERDMYVGLRWFSSCVIENVLYYYYNGVLNWYVTKVRYWKRLKGCQGLPKLAHDANVWLADYGGKMAVFWDRFVPSSGDKMIWCAVIALENRNGKEIWGSVEWCDAVLRVPKSCEFEYALAATV